mmetsp:Transcript_116539/g.324792  ORF Transcript_116539/g.324792 Transcript_116539/m.324792 type:complete len:502 (+) Transcript_116539:46-1551(+)
MAPLRRYCAQAALGHSILTCMVRASFAADGALLQGISYGVSPMQERGTLPDDDFMCEKARPQWGHPGRGDLSVMRQLGANSVRLYGNDPRFDHGAFLDAAYRLGLSVIPGISDFPYVQSPDNCKQHSDFDCYEQVKASYSQNLQRGFLQNGSYHPALTHIIAINEPDMKIPDVDAPRHFCKAVISGIDGMLDAEREAGVSGALPRITATFSFSLCPCCARLGHKPGLGQMLQLRDAMLHPELYGYAPRNDLARLLTTRFANSFNTGNRAAEIRPLFLDAYEAEFPEVPVFIAEYHCPNQDQRRDLRHVLRLARASPLLLGISFFEYQMRTDEGGHLDYGLFELGDRTVATMQYLGAEYEVQCLVPKEDPKAGRTVPAALAAAYGGSYVPDPNCSRVPRNDDGVPGLPGHGAANLQQEARGHHRRRREHHHQERHSCKTLATITTTPIGAAPATTTQIAARTSHASISGASPACTRRSILLAVAALLRLAKGIHAAEVPGGH